MVVCGNVRVLWNENIGFAHAIPNNRALSIRAPKISPTFPKISIPVRRRYHPVL